MVIAKTLLKKVARKLQPYTPINNFSRQVHLSPFPYIHLSNFFDGDFYKQIQLAFHQILSRGIKETSCEHHFSRFPHYDAYGYNLSKSLGMPLDYFSSPQWRQYVSSLFGLEFTNDITVALHHHKKGSLKGYVHNDYVRVGFVEAPLANGMNLFNETCRHILCEQEPISPNVLKRVRALAMIYYLDTPNWQPGEGGETGLFKFIEAAQPTVLIPPLANSILLFEVSPYSYHAFQSNLQYERNCIVMWFHTTGLTAIKRYLQAPKYGQKEWMQKTITSLNKMRTSCGTLS